MPTEEVAVNKKSWWINIVSFFFALPFLKLLLGLFMVLLFNIFNHSTSSSRPPEYRWMYLFGIAITPSVKLAAAIALFKLKKAAFYLFLTALLLSVLLPLLFIPLELWIQLSGTYGGIITLFDLIILIAVCIYSWRLSKKGVLQ